MYLGNLLPRVGIPSPSGATNNRVGSVEEGCQYHINYHVTNVLCNLLPTVAIPNGATNYQVETWRKT